MILFKRADQLSHYLQQLKNEGKTIGFVPTMGALHDGHLSLLAQAKQHTTITVCSIFVNPTQFNNRDDFNKYPTTIEQDIQQLTNHSCDILFLPVASEIYPDVYQAPNYDLGKLETLLEGHHRPGHFQGVCQVVDRLLQIVNPHVLLLGQKDYQQCQVIQRLLLLTGRLATSLVISPTIREADGLAMSSRNLRLNSSQRAKASVLYTALTKAKEMQDTKSIEAIRTEALALLTKEGFKVDYFEIVDADTLQPVNENTQSRIALVAAYLDDIRLIDNLPLN